MNILKTILGVGVVAVGSGIAYHKVREVKREIKRYREHEPWDVMFYALSRTVVICPRCDHMAEVQTLEAQLETLWECERCGALWRETSHSDLLVKTKGGGS